MESDDELNFRVGYDDAGLWEDRFALHPYLQFALETHDRGGSEDSYLEAGISGSHSWDLSPWSAGSVSH